MFLQPAVRQPHLHGLGLCQPVVAFGTQPDADRQPFGYTELDQVADTGARFPPLLEVAHADSAPYPVVQPFHRVKDDPCKVVHPAGEVFPELPVAVFPTDAPRAVGQLADTVLEGCQTGGAPDEVESPELIAEEAEFIHRQDAAFVGVDRQVAAPDKALYRPDSVVGVAVRAESVAVFREAGVDQRLQALHDGLLDQPVVDGGDTQQTDTAVGFGDFHPEARTVGSPTGDLHPMSSCPCRAYTSVSTTDAVTAHDFAAAPVMLTLASFRTHDTIIT